MGSIRPAPAPRLRRRRPRLRDEARGGQRGSRPFAAAVIVGEAAEDGRSTVVYKDGSTYAARPELLVPIRGGGPLTLFTATTRAYRLAAATQDVGASIGGRLRPRRNDAPTRGPRLLRRRRSTRPPTACGRPKTPCRARPFWCATCCASPIAWRANIRPSSSTSTAAGLRHGPEVRALGGTAVARRPGRREIVRGDAEAFPRGDRGLGAGAAAGLVLLLCVTVVTSLGNAVAAPRSFSLSSARRARVPPPVDVTIRNRPASPGARSRAARSRMKKSPASTTADPSE